MNIQEKFVKKNKKKALFLQYFPTIIAIILIFPNKTKVLPSMNKHRLPS